MGDDDLRYRVERLMASTRRRIVGQVPLISETTDCGPSTLVADGTWDELIVDERLFDRARAEHPELVARASRVWLTSWDGQDHGRAFADVLPPGGRTLKRLLDVVGALIGLLLLLPLVVMAAAAVKLDTRGPVFYSQMRIGANGRRFRLFKLRTMTTGNDDTAHRQYYAALVKGGAATHGGLYKLRHDARVTRAGRFLRRMSIDEVPQLWNVLRGDMSLVGPRPMQPHELELCDGRVWQRLRVRPGITGPWQVSGRSRLNFEQMVALDVEYWQSWSFYKDLRILLRTPKAVLAGDGAA